MKIRYKASDRFIDEKLNVTCFYTRDLLSLEWTGDAADIDSEINRLLRLFGL